MAIIDVIKYEGDNSTFIWKHPKEDFNTSAQLIVHESQEAIFFYGGQIMDTFGAGTFMLETENIPLLRKAQSISTGGVSPFHCEVYFINKTEQMAINWGTDSRVQYIEPTYGFPISIGASGTMSLRVQSGKQLLLKLVGTETGLQRDTLVAFFRSFLMTKVKPYIAQIMKSSKINIFEVDEHLETFSQDLLSRLSGDFADYGLSLERFFVTTIAKPDGEPQYEKFKDIHFRQYADVAEAQLRQKVGVIDQETQAKRTVIESEGKAKKRELEGYTYQQERGFDVAEKLAQNEGAGEVTSLAMGLGAAAGMGASIAAATGGVVSDAMGVAANSGQVNFCENCGKKLEPNMQFCEGCGTAAKANTCANCGQTLNETAKFCSKCGAKR